MKIKSGFIVRKIADQHMAVPVGERSQELHGMIGLNETGAFLWKLLEEDQTEESLVSALTLDYEVTQDQAKTSVQTFLNRLKDEGVLKDE